ncbi:ABC transporter ATP-binding protein [Oceanicella actignis]|uniref:ABC transporter ATP-binding protein n=1 Tax=Oceanicella actignis TaxID=1189325 RepID=UPI0011E71A76|nr:ABC transporter ATP-binding protein [Oceanicella actignis]TYO85212.1 peptide/nickel transport system ATP-binding protein [Oceanicella actignis]
MVKATPLLALEGLTIGFGDARLRVVEDVGFTLRHGETLALVGESGSGKTLTGKALIGILPRGASVLGGRAMFAARGAGGLPEAPRDLLAMRPAELRRIRGGRIAMIFQEPMSSLSPLHTIGDQVSESLRLHTELRNDAARMRCLEVFEQVGFPDPERAWSAYPFELSGGLRQRAMIAMAMACEPDLVIADEPTTALDVTTQAQVLDLIRTLQHDTGMSMILITHDLGVVANMADSVTVMRKGKVVESGPCETILTDPRHGYTRALIVAAPHVPAPRPEASAAPADPIFWARNLSKTYRGRRRGIGAPPPVIRAVQDVSLTIGRGETLALVGESGSGKTTVAKLMLRAEDPDPGAEIGFRGADGRELDVAALDGAELRDFRRRVQIVFQDPYSALSPRMSVLDILTEPLEIHGIGTREERRAHAAELMRKVGLSPEHLRRFPHAFSGGQRQRISIARALALQPELLVCDEPTSALDVSVQAQVLDLLRQLRDEMGLSYLFISHDLTVVADLADRVAVMRRGRVVEEGPAAAVFADPRHPYTKALIAASPTPDPGRRLDLAAVARGAGDPETWPEPFRYEGDRAPPLREVEPGRQVRCAA